MSDAVCCNRFNEEFEVHDASNFIPRKRPKLPDDARSNGSDMLPAQAYGMPPAPVAAVRPEQAFSETNVTDGL